ncbi:hypothetical protein E3Q19_02292 [Wallemia mellicola]|nr:hypothetical protein E3Q19_02292 [Wallemia mellicola]
MSATDLVKLALTHPLEFRTLLQYKIWYEPKRDITSPEEHATTGFDRESMRTCWDFLDKTSRSFAPVIKELDSVLARVICIFYLVLRGLDTVEDDMTIPLDVKEPILRSFHQKLYEPGWNFTESGPEEKDRHLLVKFHAVIDEFLLLDDECKKVIADITKKMGNGMADYCAAAERGQSGVEDIKDFDLYCHFVAGLVGEGLSGLFAATKLEKPFIADQLELSNSMGLFLQKTNILRDYREDVDLGREFWPMSLVKQQGFNSRADLKEPGNEEKALWVISSMVLDALRHAPDVLDYLALLKNQSVFNFAAIPQVHAIATLEACFMNPDILHKNVKIRKAAAVKILMTIRNPRDVAEKFVFYSRKIHEKLSPADPNFIKLSVALSRIEQWTERRFPSLLQFVAGHIDIKKSDKRYITFAEQEKLVSERNDAEKAARIAKDGSFDPDSTASADQVPWSLTKGFNLLDNDQDQEKRMSTEEDKIDLKIKNLQKSAINLTKISKNLLKSDDLSFQKSIDSGFSSRCEEIEDGVVDNINQLIGFINNKSRHLDADDLTGDSKAVGELVDQLLEDSSINIDKHTNNYNKPTLAKDLEPSIFNDKSIQRKPQLKWSSSIDNSDSPWKPLLTHKPNAKADLTWTTVDDRLSHPYQTEIESIKYPAQQLKTQTPIKQGDFNQTPFKWIDNEESLNYLLDRLSTATEIAIDLEHHDFRSYRGFVCLMQISIRGEDFIIDTLELRDQLIKLNDTFTNPAIVKVFHGADSDIVWLQRDFGVYIVNMFDTYHATKVLGFSQHSLASLLIKFCGYTPDKRYQRADWRKRPLTNKMLEYARSDTHYLLYIYDMLRNTLIEKSSKKNDMLKDVLQRSEQVSLKTHHRDPYDYDTGKGFGGWYNLATKWNKVVEPPLLEVFRRLHQWRDQIARKEDESVHVIFSNHQLYDLALKQPKTPQEITNVFQKKVPQFVRIHLKDVAQCINSGVEFAKNNSDKLPARVVPKSLLQPNNVHLPFKTGLDFDLWNINQSNSANSASQTSLSTSTRSKLFGEDSTKQAPQASTSKLFGDVTTTVLPKKSKTMDSISSSFKLISLIPHSTSNTEYDLDAFDEYKRPITQKAPPMPARVDEVLKEDKQKMEQEKKESEDSSMAEVPYKSKAERMADNIPIDAGITADDIATIGKQPEKKRKRKDKGEKKEKANAKDKSDKKDKKGKLEVPEFNYDNEESVLDRPLDDLSQSTKKPKKQRIKANLEGQFRRPGSSKTMQSSGNRSHTFKK